MEWFGGMVWGIEESNKTTVALGPWISMLALDFILSVAPIPVDLHGVPVVVAKPSPKPWLSVALVQYPKDSQSRRSRTAVAGMRRVNYYLKHLLVDAWLLTGFNWDHAEKSFWHCLAMFEQSRIAAWRNMRDRTLEYTAIVTIKCGFNERKQLETMNGWGTLSPGGKQYLCAQIDHLGIGFGNRISWEILTKMRMAKHGKTHQNTTRFHVVSSCFIRFLRMKRAASPQSLGAHGGHGSHGHTTFTYRMAVEAMSSVVKLSDPISRCIHCLRPCAILCGNFAGHFTDFYGVDSWSIRSKEI